jgi:hypothetical protein
MKKFIYKIVALLIVIIFSAIILDKAYTYIYLNKTPRTRASYLIQNKVNDVDYIFLGSSRVQNHINTKLINDLTNKKAINLGVQGAKLNDYELFLNLIVANKIKYEKIFLQVDYVYNHTGFSDISGADVIPYIKDIKEADKHLKTYNTNYHNYKNIPFYRYMVNDFSIGFREVVMLSINRKSKVDFEDGFDPKFIVGKNLSSSLPKKINLKNNSFTRIDSIARANKIDIIYFMAPFCANTSNPNFGELLSQRIPGFKDYSRAILEDKYFYNCSHLNSDGANLFTEILINELNL